MRNKFLLTYFSFCLSFFIFFASGFVDSLDGFLYLTVARRMYYNHTFELPNESLANNQNIWLTPLPGIEGKTFSPTGLGYSVALLPAVFMEDMFLKAANQTPLSAFPLQSDWPVLLFASFTNSFFGALLAVTLYKYFLLYYLPKKTSLLLSFISIVGTNLFVYTKHVMAHMMFISFLTVSFYQVKKYSISKKPIQLLFAGVTFGLTAISYNGSYLFSIPVLIVYYLFLVRPKLEISSFKRLTRDVVFALIGFIPFFLLNKWFNFVRLGPPSIETQVETAVSIGRSLLPPFYIMFEGIWNVLLSPGRSIFVYSPILLLIFLFWFKLKKSLLPEVIAFSLLFIIYTIVIGVQTHGPDYPVWHGEFSWGPRYMLPVIPLLMILVGNIYQELRKREKLLIFLPLVAIGLYLELVGLFLPYQIKFGGLDSSIKTNGHHFNVTLYANEIPRYAPPFTMSKKLVKSVLNLNSLYNHGAFDLRLYDGFDAPYDAGQGVWRGINEEAFLSINNNNVNNVSFLISNHLMTNTKFVLSVMVFENNELITQDSIDPGKEKTIFINTKNKSQESTIKLQTTFLNQGKAVNAKDKQVAFLKELKINNLTQNLSTMDFPYYSPVSKSLYGVDYFYWGERNTNYYDLWDVHSRVYEQTYDLWWLRPYHYWDYPKTLFNLALLMNIFSILFLFRLIVKIINLKF